MNRLDRPSPAPLMVLTYDPGQRCPGCGKRHWHIGRTVAECASCEFALPLTGEAPAIKGEVW